MRKKRSASPDQGENEVLFLAGLGMDREIFYPILGEILFRNLPLRFREVVNTPMLHRGETFSSYTKRLLYDQEAMGREYLCVVGYSMGGLMAQEALERGWIRTKNLILISTGFRGEHMTGWVRAMARILPHAPALLRRPLLLMARFLYRLLRITHPWSGIVSGMIGRYSPALLFQAPEMMLRWRSGEERPDDAELFSSLPENTLLYMGTKDPLFSFRRVSTCRLPNRLYRKGDHLLIVESATQVADDLASMLESSPSPSPAARGNSRTTRKSKSHR